MKEGEKELPLIVPVMSYKPTPKLFETVTVHIIDYPKWDHVTIKATFSVKYLRQLSRVVFTVLRTGKVSIEYGKFSEIFHLKDYIVDQMIEEFVESFYIESFLEFVGHYSDRIEKHKKLLEERNHERR